MYSVEKRVVLPGKNKYGDFRYTKFMYYDKNLNVVKENFDNLDQYFDTFDAADNARKILMSKHDNDKDGELQLIQVIEIED